VSEALERAVVARREDLDAARRAAQHTAARLPSLEALAEAWRSSRRARARGVQGLVAGAVRARAGSVRRGRGDGALPRSPADRSFMRRHARRGRAGPRPTSRAASGAPAVWTR
jgi:hypothetical protein